MPFHLNTVYFQWCRKGTPRIISFVLSPLSGAFFLITLKLVILFIVRSHVFPIEKEYLFFKKRKLKCVD